MGFKRVGEVRVGKGEVDEDGRTKVGGEGAKMVAMIMEGK